MFPVDGIGTAGCVVEWLTSVAFGGGSRVLLCIRDMRSSRHHAVTAKDLSI